MRNLRDVSKIVTPRYNTEFLSVHLGNIKNIQLCPSFFHNTIANKIQKRVENIYHTHILIFEKHCYYFSLLYKIL